MPLPAPLGWGQDYLSAFIEHAHDNAKVTFVKLKDDFERLAQIDGLFRDAPGGIGNAEPLVAGFLLARASSAYLAGVRLSVSGQVREAYVVLRAVLEDALYAHHVRVVPGSEDMWLHRDESEQEKKTMKGEFTITALMCELEKAEGNTGRTARELYEWLIAWGAHPNPSGVFANMGITEDQDKVTFRHDVLRCGGEPHLLCLRKNAQVGVSALSIFELIWPDMFTSRGLSQALAEAKKGL